MSKLLESGENYLETILILEKEGKSVRSIDIANELSFSKPSISRAMGILKDGGFILIDDNGYILLTDAGKKTAETIYERHRVLSEFLIHIGVNEKTATEDACKIEHYISSESFLKLKNFIIKNKL